MANLLPEINSLVFATLLLLKAQFINVLNTQVYAVC